MDRGCGGVELRGGVADVRTAIDDIDRQDHRQVGRQSDIPQGCRYVDAGGGLLPRQGADQPQLHEQGVAQADLGLAVEREQIDEVGDIGIAHIAQGLLLLRIGQELFAVVGGAAGDAHLVGQGGRLHRRADHIGDQGAPRRLGLEFHPPGLIFGGPQAFAARPPDIGRIADVNACRMQGIEAGRIIAAQRVRQAVGAPRTLKAVADRSLRPQVGGLRRIGLTRRGKGGVLGLQVGVGGERPGDQGIDLRRAKGRPPLVRRRGVEALRHAGRLGQGLAVACRGIGLRGDLWQRRRIAGAATEQKRQGQGSPA